jgi:hypothetical protein
MPEIRLAFDRTARIIDADGRLHVERSHISKANICGYLGREIPGYEELGLDPDKVYQLLRDPEELKKAAPTFERIPILSEHVPVTVDSPRPDLVIGAIGSDVEFVAPYLDADLCFWDANAIAGIETNDVRELSCAYRYKPVMEPGTYEGKPYDGRMTDIIGNHLALVSAGRAGPDVVVADSNPFSFKEKTMYMTKLGKALFAALSAASPKLAADAALPALVGKASRKTFKKAEVKPKLLALDVELDPQQLDNILDALLDVEQEPQPIEPAATDESPEEQLRKLLEGKVDDATLQAALALIAPKVEDEVPAEPKEAGMKEEEVKAAMDAAIKASKEAMLKEFREAAEAQRDVRATVGDVIGMDSAADVYCFALDHMKIDHTGVEGVPALRALYRVAASKAAAPAPRVAQDAAGAVEKFPGLARFRIA